MALDNHRQTQPPADLTTSEQRIGEPGYAPVANGVPDGTPAAEPAPPASSVERAEHIADHMAEKCAAVAAACVRKLAWFTARAREAAEDVWAEAQSIRRKEQP